MHQAQKQGGKLRRVAVNDLEEIGGVDEAAVVRDGGVGGAFPVTVP